LYDFEIERVSEEIRRRNAKRVLLQLPNGLRPHALKLLQALRDRTNAGFILSGDTCFGACDIAIRQAEALEADLLVHYGHSQMLLEVNFPVLYIEVRVNLEIDGLIERVLPLIERWRVVGLVTSAQHLHLLSVMAEALKLRMKRFAIGRVDSNMLHDGQVLGCDYSSALTISENVDGFLFLGGGRFHPIGLALATGKPVVAADPFLSTVLEFKEKQLKRFAMKRMAAITAAKDAKSFLILVSLKPGQYDLQKAEIFQTKLKNQGREVAIVCFDEIRSESLINFSRAEAFINTACPRIATDGIRDVRKPILTVQEALVMLGEKRWEEIWGGSYLELS
jgi:2-(3-amino-3-carboxypropyl)histidine synthase